MTTNVPLLLKVLDAHSGLFGHLSQETTVSYDSDGYDGSDELTPPTPHHYAK